ncbi:MAG: UDP-N-acetylmuramoyl-L-alanine--D-glutamate ligase [Candidatus Coatesbacteria bacterium]|nr:UDP-N-acetylmuramoyl-L-alanine--D-glutamate ligase [Candidatus Coatesbacteria bacterium]
MDLKTLVTPRNTIGIIGFARTGIATAQFLTNRGVKVYVTEQKKRDEIVDVDSLISLEAHGVKFEWEGHSPYFAESVDMVVISPGVSKDQPVFSFLDARKVPIISEIELASWFFKGKIIAVTGSNGKSTTVSLIHHILKYAGFDSYLAGNIGTPFVSVLDKSSNKSYVTLELSSFQLDDIKYFKPNSAIILNITEDHLDRYVNIDDYKKSKFRIFENMNSNDRIVINCADPIIASSEITNSSEKIYINKLNKEGSGFFLEGMKISKKTGVGEEIVLLDAKDSISLLGPHNRFNILASWALIDNLNIPIKVLRESINTFSPLPHRLQTIAEINKVKYINDSKATNPASMEVALKSFKDNSIILIAGGYDKHNDFSCLTDLVSNKCKFILGIGKLGKDLVDLWNKNSEYVKTLQKAIIKAFEIAQPGDNVLLSPGCASFDQFNNFEHRGQVFVDLVKEIEERNA